MLIKDQIRMRREALGYSHADVAKKLDISEQAVRHWENGRSYPSKSKMHDIEQVLSFTLDWTEGKRPSGETGNTAASMIDQSDIELLLVIGRLPKRAKDLMGELARMHLQAVEAARNVAPAQPPEPPAAPAARKSRARA